MSTVATLGLLLHKCACRHSFSPLFPNIHFSTFIWLSVFHQSRINIINKYISISSERAPDLDSMKMFVGQIPKDWNEDDCRKLLEPYGEIYSINILRDKETKKSKGKGWILCWCLRFFTVRSTRYSRKQIDSEAEPANLGVCVYCLRLQYCCLSAQLLSAKCKQKPTGCGGCDGVFTQSKTSFSIRCLSVNLSPPTLHHHLRRPRSIIDFIHPVWVSEKWRQKFFFFVSGILLITIEVWRKINQTWFISKFFYRTRQMELFSRKRERGRETLPVHLCPMMWGGCCCFLPPAILLYLL